MASLNTKLATTPNVSANYVLKATTSTTIGNSLIFDNGTNVGIGNTNTSFTLDVTGTGRFTGALTLSASTGFPSVGLLNRSSDNNLYIVSASSGFVLLDNSQNTMYNATPTSHTWQISNSPKMTLNSSGNVGIGTSNPNAILSLYGATTAYMNFRNATNQSSTFGFVVEATGNETELWNYANGYMRFGTNNAERMRILSTGEVGIGVTPKLAASVWRSVQVGNFVLMSPAPATDPNAIIGANSYRAYDNTWKRVIGGYANLIELNQGNGDIRTYTGNTGTADTIISYVNGPFLSNGGVSWTNGSSDVRKKKNFEPSQGLAEVLQIEAVKYHFNWDEENKSKRLGFKAQNLQTLIPEMVSETGEFAEDGSPYLTITPDYILPVLVKAIQELNQQVQHQQQTINSLINR